MAVWPVLVRVHVRYIPISSPSKLPAAARFFSHVMGSVPPISSANFSAMFSPSHT